LYSLSNSKDKVVREIGEWREGYWYWKASWRRERLAREKDLEKQFMRVIDGQHPKLGNKDIWIWK